MGEALSGLQTVAYEKRDHLAFITMNRPDVLNARNRQLRHDLLLAFQDANGDPAVRVMILTGAGQRAFSVGRGLRERLEANQRTPLERREERRQPNDIEYLAAVEKPVIAAINGYALGGGLELALCCDLRVAADHAQLGLPEAGRGLMPGNGGTQRLPRIVGTARALELLLLAEPISAHEAYRIGLVNRVVAGAELMTVTEQMARTIMTRAPVALQFIKQAVRRGSSASLEAGLSLEADLATLLATSDDAKEGTRAFAEKRAPNWQGR